ncbi:MAG: PAS domain-containing protein [Gammaproteobacteria bacterium]|nr:PAS domain-containing protein [Gammaproteobacteria bacterium]
MGIKLHNSPKPSAKNQAPDLVTDERYGNIIRCLPQVVFEIDLQGQWCFLNRSWSQLSGFEVNECIGTNFIDYVHPQDRSRSKEIFAKMQCGEVDHCTQAFRFLISDGNYLWTEIHAAVARSSDQQINGIVGTINNISDRVSEEELVLANQRTLTALLNDLPGMVYRCRNNPDWTMEYVSGSSYKLTGYHPEDIINNKRLSYGSMIHPDDQQAVWEEVQSGIRENRRFEKTYRITTADNKIKWVWECGKGIFSSNHEWLGLEGFITDTLNKENYSRNRLISILYDDVTGLPTPQLFNDRLQNAILRTATDGHQLTVYVVHLNRLLNALESADNDAIDRLSREVAQRLGKLIGPQDSITGLENERWGLLIETTRGQSSVTDFAQKIQDAFLTPLMISSSEVFVTTSIGASHCESHEQAAEELLRHASHAMHHAHALGGGRIELYDARVHNQYIGKL